jgi:hypothetical protein
VAESQSFQSKNDKYGGCHSPFGGCPMPYCTETNACQVSDHAKTSAPWHVSES